MANKMRETDDTPNTVEVINISGEPAQFELNGTRFKLLPKESLLVHKNHATARQSPGRDPVASAIELLTNARVLPVDDKRSRSAVASRDAMRRQSEEQS